MDKINYEEIYDHCKAICPEMQSVIEYVRNISSSNKEIKNTVDRLKGGDMSAVKRYIELYMKKALMYSLAAAKQSGLPLDELFSEAVSVAAQRAVDLAEHNIKKVTLMSSMSSDIKNRLQKYIFEYNDFSRYEISELKVGYDGEKLMLEKICTPEFNDLLNEAM